MKTSEGGGWALRLMRDLVNLGVEVHAALPFDGCLIPEYKKNGIIIHEYNCSLKSLNKSIKNLRIIVDEIKPDIIHSHFVLTTIIMRLGLRNLKIPRIFEVPGPLHLEHFHTRLVDILLAQKNDYWIATCKWTKDRYLKSGINPKQVLQTFYGGDFENLPDYPKGKLRKEFGISDNTFIVGMVAFMYEPKKIIGQTRGIKGHEDFIDAIAILNKKYPDIQGICVGGAWDNALDYEKKVKEYARKKGSNIIFTGTRNDVMELYPDFNCVVHPSHSENLGGAGESLLNEIPTIATKVGGFPDIVIHGKTGLLVEPKDPEAIASAIEQFYKDKIFAKECSIRGKKLVIKQLNSRITSQEVYSFYNKIFKSI